MKVLHGWWSDEQAKRTGKVFVCLDAAGAEVRVTEVTSPGDSPDAWPDMRSVGMVQWPPLRTDVAPWWLAMARAGGEGGR